MITYDCKAVEVKLMEAINEKPEEYEPQSSMAGGHVMKYSYSVILPILVTIGLVGNLMNVVVFGHQRMRMPSGFHLTLLSVAIADSGVLICAILDIVQNSNLIFEDGDQFSLSLRICEIVKYPLQNTFKHASIWFLILSALIRFIGVRFPLQATCWLTKRRTTIAIVAISIACAIFNVPRVFETELLVCPDERSDFTIVANTKMGDSHAYKHIYPWFNSTLFFVVPFTLLLIFNLFLLFDIWRQKTIRKRLSNRPSLSSSNGKSQVNERQITTMVVVVITLFLLLESPVAIVDALHEGSVRISAAKLRKDALETVNMISIANCSINLFIYLCFSQKFRQLFLNIFCGCFMPVVLRQSTQATPINSRNSRPSSQEQPRNSRIRISSENRPNEVKTSVEIQMMDLNNV